MPVFLNEVPYFKRKNYPQFPERTVAVGFKLFQPEFGFCCYAVISSSDTALLHCPTAVIP
jgi:hypothetical protein